MKRPRQSSGAPQGVLTKRILSPFGRFPIGREESGSSAPGAGNVDLAAAGLDSLPSWLRTPLDKLAVWGAALAALVWHLAPPAAFAETTRLLP